MPFTAGGLPRSASAIPLPVDYAQAVYAVAPRMTDTSHCTPTTTPTWRSRPTGRFTRSETRLTVACSHSQVVPTQSKDQYTQGTFCTTSATSSAPCQPTSQSSIMARSRAGDMRGMAERTFTTVEPAAPRALDLRMSQQANAGLQLSTLRVPSSPGGSGAINDLPGPPTRATNGASTDLSVSGCSVGSF